MKRKRTVSDPLVKDGGKPLRTRPWPGRGHFGRAERAAVNALFDEAIRTGYAPGYNGPHEEAYCKAFARYMGGGFADAVNSGTTAVYVALRSLDLEPFTEVVVSALTDPGGLMPIPLLNCIPMVADVAPGSYNTGPDQIAPLITKRTSAILVAHIAGEPADMAGIMKLARRHRLPVVEDCSQAHGARLNGRLVGTFGEVAAFSTMFGKHHCTGGQGGVVFTRQEKLYWRSRQVSDRGKPFGLPPGSENCVASLNYNLSDLGGVIGLAQLRKLPGIVRRRRAVVAKLASLIQGVRTVSIPRPLPGAEPSYWFLRMRFHPEAARCGKSEFFAALAAEGLPGAEDYTLHAPHRKDWFRNRRVFGTSGFPWTCPLYKGNPDRPFPCPNLDQVGATHFNISISEGWSDTDVRDAAAIIRKVDAGLGRS
jgi:dTDP-4-amino-4,6-dideoxygalactose transaminase